MTTSATRRCGAWGAETSSSPSFTGLDWPPKGGSGANTALALPISIGRADFGGFEGQVAPSMAQRVGELEGKLVQVRVCFGTAAPSNALIAQANATLQTFALT